MHEVKECILKQQFIIDPKRAKTVGKQNLEKQTDELLRRMFNDICREVLGSECENSLFVVQWALMKIDRYEGIK